MSHYRETLHILFAHYSVVRLLIILGHIYVHVKVLGAQFWHV